MDLYERESEERRIAEIEEKAYIYNKDIISELLQINEEIRRASDAIISLENTIRNCFSHQMQKQTTAHSRFKIAALILLGIIAYYVKASKY